MLDEIHRLDNPSELLKIAADHFPKTKILATGSSSLTASAKFKDTLAGRKAEIVAAPKVYMFDTGFVCYYRGWHELKTKELGFLWEHYVLNELQARLQSRQIHYWRDKQGHEIDFVLARRGLPPIAIEVKWANHDFDLSSLKAFHHQYPNSEIFVVNSELSHAVVKKINGVKIKFTNLSNLLKHIV